MIKNIYIIVAPIFPLILFIKKNFPPIIPTKFMENKRPSCDGNKNFVPNL